ncbi:hypothetical protein GXB85_16325 [Cellulomonas sp. APG4]|uniref:VOC family protein n=1 Tax=Cellulomonas sp. APG4 TaxID=1538656 RepID=UPI00137B0250|nr:VOC family protein [Cellulomonas sp. APG4]NCT92503.1 hypothetical protein [Cellulomonas sp. APG4]
MTTLTPPRRRPSGPRPTTGVHALTSAAPQPRPPHALPARMRPAEPTPRTTPTGAVGPASTAFAGLTYDAFDALGAASFWAAALRVDVQAGATSARAELAPSADAGLPAVVFRQVTEGRPLATPLHLRLTTTDLEAESRRLEHLGARRLGTATDRTLRTRTFADPEGNAFDLVAA